MLKLVVGKISSSCGSSEVRNTSLRLFWPRTWPRNEVVCVVAVVYVFLLFAELVYFVVLMVYNSGVGCKMPLSVQLF